jgi:hypothetical protein
VTAIGLLALPALLLAPPGTPLDADVFDASALPTVLFDVVAPRDFAAVDLTPAMFQVDGGTVTAVTEVDPATVAVSLVIDDSPTLTPAVVNEGQGASVELVRNTGDGTQISLSTPSGMQTALTTDRDANIARISGIVAGSPDVVKLPDLLVDAARRLAAAPVKDRHLVAVIGTTIPDGPQLQALRGIVIPAGIRLHVVAAPGVEVGPIAGLAAESGGIDPVLPKPVGEIDAVTQAIRDRYRVTATVDGAGEHDVALAVGGQTFGAALDVPTPPPPPTTSATPPTTAGAAQGPAVAAPTTAAVATPAASTTTPATTSEPSSGLSRGARILIVLLALVAVGGFGIFFLSTRRAAEAKRRRKARAAARALAAAAEDTAAQAEAAVSATPADAEADVPPVVYWERRRKHRRQPATSDVQPIIRWNRRRTDHRELPPFEQPPALPTGTEAAEPEPVPEPVMSEPEPVVVAPEPAAIPPEPEPVEEAAAVSEHDTPPAAAPMSAWASRRRKRARRELAAAAMAAAAAESPPSAEAEPAAPEPEPVAPEPATAEPEPVATAPEPATAEPDPVAAEPESEPIAPQPQPEPVPEQVPVVAEPLTAAAASDTEATAVEGQPVAARRGRPLNDRPRRQSARQAAPEEPVSAEEQSDEEPQSRRGRRRAAAERSAPARTRRGPLADLPKRARTRRRFDDIPLIEPSAEAAGDERRSGGAEPEWLESGDLRMCPSTGAVIANGREVSLTAAELGVLELLLTSGNEGVTPEAIKAAAGAGDDDGEEVDPDAIVLQLRRKTGLRGRNTGMRKERVLLYFLGDDEGSADA